MERQDGLRRVIELSGGQARLAAALSGLRPPGESIGSTAIANWLKRGVVPPEWVLDCSKVVAFRVPPHEIRSDLYPHPDDGLPEPMRKGGKSPDEILEQLREVMTEDELRELTIALDQGEAVALGFVRGLAEKHRIAWTDTLIAQGLAAMAKERRPS